MILFFRLFTFLKTNSHNKPVPNNKTPAIMKSAMFQLTSRVNCIAISGINSRVATDTKITINLLFFIVFFWGVKLLVRKVSLDSVLAFKKCGVFSAELLPISENYYSKK